MEKVFLWLTIFLLILFTFSCNSNKKGVWVLDNELDLTPDQITRLDSLYKSHEKRTTNEIALVTTSGYGRESTILFFAVNFLRSYGVGKKDKNNGVVIVLSIKKHETFITTGYGTEKVLRDQIAKKIIDSLMIPNFKQAKYLEGIWEGSKAIAEFLEKPENEIN
ncbi:MAG TPA: TPM domain-containing protein [Puia sp.]|jgi:uncharacterized protein|nr:TPM domain-containing protein [Puia sp.]